MPIFLKTHYTDRFVDSTGCDATTRSLSGQTLPNDGGCPVDHSGDQACRKARRLTMSDAPPTQFGRESCGSACDLADQPGDQACRVPAESLYVDTIVDVLVARQRQAPQVQTEPNTVVVPLGQFVDRAWRACL